MHPVHVRQLRWWKGPKEDRITTTMIKEIGRYSLGNTKVRNGRKLQGNASGNQSEKTTRQFSDAEQGRNGSQRNDKRIDKFKTPAQQKLDKAEKSCRRCRQAH